MQCLTVNPFATEALSPEAAQSAFILQRLVVLWTLYMLYRKRCRQIQEGFW